jgi:hypothetical protein
MKIRFAVFFTAILLLLFTSCGTKIPSGTTISTTTPTMTTPTTPTTTIVTPAVTLKPSVTTSTTTTTKAQPPATVTGLIYKRDAATSFAVNAAPTALALSGATVTIEQDKLVTDASGSFSFTTLAPGFHTIIITKDGYIPNKVSWTFESGKSYAFNIGLYQAPTAVFSKTNFTRGVISWDAGGWLIDYYYKRGLFPPTYSAAAQNAGASLVTVSDPVFIKSADINKVVMSTVSNSGSYWRMMNETEYAALVKDAHSKGLQFMLWLGVFDIGDTPYYQIVWKDGARENSFWDSWFSEYEKYSVQYAAMAEKLGIEYVNLGHDMGYATGSSRYDIGANDCLARWKHLVNAIRSVYHGKVTYFGGTAVADATHSYYEDNDYPQGFTKLFDALGINVQSVSPKFNPTLAELKTNLGKLFDRYIDWECPVFVMVRTPSVDGGTSFENYIEPLLVVNHEADKHAMNLLQQADMYEAIFELINQRSVGNGQIMGVFPWGYNYLDDYLNVPNQKDGAMAMDKSGNIRGKPAEAVLKYWNFGK